MLSNCIRCIKIYARCSYEYNYGINKPLGSKYLASSAWVTGSSLRGPHVNFGFADEMQDWTREAFEVFKEVVNLPPAQVFCAGTPKDKGSFLEELWLSSDMKEWNCKEWIRTNRAGCLLGDHAQANSMSSTQGFLMMARPEIRCSCGHSQDG